MKTLLNEMGWSQIEKRNLPLNIRHAIKKIKTSSSIYKSIRDGANSAS